jgi:hypothetical protein
MANFKKKNFSQIVRDLSEMKSPIHNFNENELIDIILIMNVALPIKYIEGELCPECILKYSKKIEINEHNFAAVVSASNIDSPINCTLRVYAVT